MAGLSVISQVKNHLSFSCTNKFMKFYFDIQTILFVISCNWNTNSEASWNNQGLKDYRESTLLMRILSSAY